MPPTSAGTSASPRRRKRSKVGAGARCSPKQLVGLIPGYDPGRDAGACVFDNAVAARALDFFGRAFIHVDGPLGGRQFMPEPWEAAIIANLFGWLRPDGTRRYRECMIYVPRKNGKTFLAATLGIHLLFCDREPGAQIYVAASDAEQAEILHRVAKQQVLRNRSLGRHAEVWRRRIVLKGTPSYFESLNSSPNSKWGFNSHGILVDELHALSKPEDRALLEALETSRGARRQPLLVYLTTADVARESLCNSRVGYARQVRDNPGLDPYYLPVLYETPMDADWTDPEVWRRANPNLGVSIEESWLAEECRKARLFPERQNSFRRLYLNQQTDQAKRWIMMEAWDGCSGAPSPPEGSECFGGLDLGSVDDLSALVLAFPRPDGIVDVLPFFWGPEDGLRKKERTDRAPYEVWRDAGLIESTPSRTTDYDRIRARIAQVSTRYRIRELAVDRWNATQLIGQLADDGLKVKPFGQGYASMAAPSRELERLVLEGKIRHGGHPVLRWMCSNLAAETDAAGNLKPSKARSGDKIDGMVALIMALGILATGGGAKQRSVYEERGLLEPWENEDKPR